MDDWRVGFLFCLSSFDFSLPSPFLPRFSRARRVGKRACALAALRASAFCGPPQKNQAKAARFFWLPRKKQPLAWRAGAPLAFGCAARSGAEKEKNMIEEIKAGQTNEKQSKKVGSSQDGAGPQGHTGSARCDAERKDKNPTLSWPAALLELLRSKKIPSLDVLQMQGLLHYMYKAADTPLRLQVAEVAYRYNHNHPNARDLFLACTLPWAKKAARRKAEKLFVHPSDWQVELMYDGAVSAAIKVFQRNSPLSPIPNAFRRYLLRTLYRHMLRRYFMRGENCGIRPAGDVRTVRTRKTGVPTTIERDVIARDLLDKVTNYPNLPPRVRATLQCIATLGPHFVLRGRAYTASGDPDKWKSNRDRRPVLDPDAIAEAMGVRKADVHNYLHQAREILRQAFNADGRLFQIH
jgi:hypothetical protein